jgi:hypothetical protein
MRKNNFACFGLSLILCFAVILSACSTEWVGAAQEIVAALIPATSNLVALVAALQGNEASAGDLQLIQSTAAQVGTDLQLVQSLIAAYQKADEAARPGILAQIQNAISAVQMNLHGLLQGLHLKDAATQSKVTAVIGIVLAEVQSLAALLPAIQAHGTGAGEQGAASPKDPQLSHMPGEVAHPALSAHEFVSSYNSTLTARSGNAAVDRTTAGLRIRLHSSAVRWVSAGMLK